jgi:pilus assembly protein Flp/PilA
MVTILKSFVRDESGATMIEYGLIAALVSVAAIAALVTLGGDLTTIFGHVSTCLENSISATGC